MRHILGSTVSSIVLAAAVAAHAQDASAPDVAGAGAANAVSTVVVTANRTGEAVQKVGQSVTVLTLPQIQADQETN
ncbi:MAG: TonB-dependent receptor, partial [Caulobacteraceae bacterium]|nr:TonB-dependent receptor [Caulobacteraceae bacterium]